MITMFINIIFLWLYINLYKKIIFPYIFKHRLQSCNLLHKYMILERILNYYLEYLNITLFFINVENAIYTLRNTFTIKNDLLYQRSSFVVIVFIEM